MNMYYVWSLIWFILWIWALIDCLTSPVANKIVWVILIILLPFLGSILYFLIGKSSRV